MISLRKLTLLYSQLRSFAVAGAEAHPSGQAAPALRRAAESRLQVVAHLKTPAPASALREETLTKSLEKCLILSSKQVNKHKHKNGLEQTEGDRVLAAMPQP